jgi:hypothetical protein
MAVRWIFLLVLVVSMGHEFEARVLLENGITYCSASKGRAEVEMTCYWVYNNELKGKRRLAEVDRKRAVPGGPDPQHHF